MPVKSILDDPYEEWSAGLDFQWVDESEDLAVDNMVRLILEGFLFRKEMFKGGLNAIDLSRLRGEKKGKEKEPKVKNDKDHVAEVSEGEGSSDLHDIISSMEERIYQHLDAKLEKLAPPTSQSPQAALLQDLDKKIADYLSLQLKDMQAAIIKGVIDGIVGNTINGRPVNDKEPPMFPFTTPSEAADSRINAVLRELNDVSDVHLPANTESLPKSLDQEAPDADDAQPQAEHIKEHIEVSATLDQVLT